MKVSLRFKNLFFQILAWCAFGLMLTIIFLKFSPLLVTVALAGLLFIFAALKRPEIAILGILVFTSSIIFEDQLPSLSIGGITLLIPDILLLGLLGLIVVRSLVEPQFKIVKTPLDWPLLIFVGMMLLATLLAIFNTSLEYGVAIGWIRIMSYYLIFFIVTNLVRDRSQLSFLLKGLFLMAAIVSIAVMAQFLLGASVQLISGRVEDLSAEGASLFGILRIAAPGLSIIVVSFFALLCILILNKSLSERIPGFISISLMAGALILTFLRSLWAAIIMVISLLMVLFRGKDRRRMITLGLVVVSLLAIILLIVFINPGSRAERLVSSLYDRLSTLSKTTTFQGQDSSLNWRLLEDGYAFTSFAAHPLIGIGMGARYRPYDRRLTVYGDPYDYRMHIHNGYLWILIDLGLLGFLPLLWFSLTFLIRGFKFWRRISDSSMRGVVLGFTLAYLAVMIAAVANSIFVQWNWIPVIGIIMGINEVILKGVGQEILTK